MQILKIPKEVRSTNSENLALILLNAPVSYKNVFNTLGDKEEGMDSSTVSVRKY